MSNANKGILAALGAVLLWSSTYAAVKIALESVPPLTLALIRGIIASLILLLITILRGQVNKLPTIVKKDILLTLALGATGFTLLHILQNLGLERTSTGLTSVLINTDPLFILFFAALILKEKITFNKAFGMAVGFIGIIIIVLIGENFSTLINSEIFLGNILILLAALSWSTYSVLIKKATVKYSSSTLTVASLITGTLLLLPLTLKLEASQLMSLNTSSIWLLLLYLGFITGAAGLFWNYALSHLEATRVGIFLFLIPVIGIAIGIIFLNESLALNHIIGVVLVLSGIYLTERKF